MQAWIERSLRALALAASAVLLAGFALFAVDELRHASLAQRAKVTTHDLVTPDPRAERVRERETSTARELVEDAGDVLLAPFEGIVESDDAWVVRGVPTLLALLVFGFGLGFVARFTRGRA